MQWLNCNFGWHRIHETKFRAAKGCLPVSRISNKASCNLFIKFNIEKSDICPHSIFTCSHVLSFWSRHRECWWIQIQLDVLNWFKFNMNLISSQFSLSQVKLRESQFYISYLFIRGAKCSNFTFQDSLSLSSQQCKPLASDVIMFIESLVFKKHTHTHTHKSMQLHGKMLVL